MTRSPRLVVRPRPAPQSGNHRVTNIGTGLRPIATRARDLLLRRRFRNVAGDASCGLTYHLAALTEAGCSPKKPPLLWSTAPYGATSGMARPRTLPTT